MIFTKTVKPALQSALRNLRFPRKVETIYYSSELGVFFYTQMILKCETTHESAASCITFLSGRFISTYHRFLG